MAKSTKPKCSVCRWEAANGATVDASKDHNEWADITEIHRTTITRHLAHAETAEVAADGKGAGYSFDAKDGGAAINIEKRADRIIPLSEWLIDLAAELVKIESPYTVDDYQHSIGHSVWTQHTKNQITKTLYANRFSATLKTGKAKAEAELDAIDWDAAAKFVEGFTYIPAKREFLVDASILQPTDEQWGKTDFDGGTPETEERVLNSYSAYADYIREFRPRQVLFARTGDGIENACSTSSQRDTNDLDLPHMLVQSYKMDIQGLKMIAPLVAEVKDVRVPSNHGRWRVGMKADAGNPHADFGIGVGKQIAATQAAFDILPNVEFLFPDALMESVTVALDTVRIGLVHGHQVNSPDRLPDWWTKQDHGRMPTWDADILLAGHFHSLRVQQSGDKRWFMVGPASDPGSSWYSNLKGVRSTSGMLALTITGKRWHNLEIL